MKNRYLIGWDIEDAMYGLNHDQNCGAYAITMNKKDAIEFRKRSKTRDGLPKLFKVVECKEGAE